MDHIVTVQDAVTAFADWMEPTDAELKAIELEMPAILADVDQVDAEIAALENRPNELSTRRVRRARRRALTARVALLNQTGGTSVEEDAA
ncbi:hypothetical protein BSZ07_22845 [Streptomyces sp. M1013]|uniref:DUF6284 family protein n=1 Tax=Streptomyces sp. M1013 TaxID=549798 RepID=UPI000978E706|nr:DUF6284 family protein [Streptomyces sp. M1013]OMI87099.1 hypothetical protein BSZ07_22845 [Streptomyces sp. M1013]